MFTKFLALFALFIGTAQAAYFPTVSINNFDALGIYNLTLPVLTDGGMSQLQLDINGRLLVDDNHASDWASLLSNAASIDSKLPSNLTVASSMLLVDGSGSTQPISAAALPLPTGAATEATLANVDATLTTIDSKLVTVDTSNVTVNSSVLPTGAATETTLSAVNTKIPTNLTVSSTRLLVDGSGVTQPVSGTVTVSNPGLTDAELRASAVPVSVASIALPTGASTEAKQDVGNASLASIDTKLTDRSQAAKITNGTIEADIKPLSTQVVGADNGLIVNAALHGLTTAGGGSYVDVKVTPSGAMAVDATISSSALPTGAATEAKQDTGNASLASIDSKLTSPLAIEGGNATAVKVDGSAVTQPVSIAAAVATKAPVNAGGSTVSASISAVDTLTAPANAVEVIIQADDANTANLRFAVGSAATTTDGIQLQPGRSETLKVGSNISIIPESGTQKYNVIWVTQ